MLFYIMWLFFETISLIIKTLKDETIGKVLYRLWKHSYPCCYFTNLILLGDWGLITFEGIYMLQFIIYINAVRKKLVLTFIIICKIRNAHSLSEIQKHSKISGGERSPPLNLQYSRSTFSYYFFFFFQNII